MIGPDQVEAIERATLAALGVQARAEIGGWLLAMDAGPILRAASAVPLRHDLAADERALEQIEAAYAGHGLPPAFRVADEAALGSVRQALSARGYRAGQPSLVMVGKASALRALTTAAPCGTALAPDEAWAAAFLGEGFDPLDGARRSGALMRCDDAVFGAVREDGLALAVGAAAFGFGWASIHGMRTVKARRGEGLAARVLAGLALAAEARGFDEVFLQVDEANAPARALYARAGFETAWRYLYWSRLS